ncbi:coenzyme Q biosynthesis protein Coq4-domain-containing protein [Kalaharituber pfeilii]|nr:coenzyme Q biosynthesis protein Coq4-domain-containing protein [Kalaharituber pfeilii]
MAPLRARAGAAIFSFLAPTPRARCFSVLSRPPPLYPHHVPLTPLESSLLAFLSTVGAFLNPRRGDLVALVSETTAFMIPRLHRTMLSSPTGRLLLRTKPRISSSTLPPVSALLSLPANTLGHTYASWLQSNHVSPDTRSPVRHLPTPELAYVLQRYRESHDFYHTITGLPVFREGEVALKLFEFCNTLLPMTGMAALTALTLNKEQRGRMWGIYFPWAVENGLKCQPLINVYWEKELETDIGELRARLGIEPPPDLRALRRAEKEKKQKQKAENEQEQLAQASSLSSPLSTASPN